MNTDSSLHDTSMSPPPLPPQATEDTSAKPPSAPAREWQCPPLPKLLRWLGATTLLASALAFLVKDWMQTDEVFRYLQFLGLTVLLSGCGWFCISRWKDDKGARTFFALGAALLPANFAQLGAMLYAKQIGQESFNGFREAFAFTDPGPLMWPTFAGALLLLIPLTYLGFAAMARKQAKKLTLLYIIGNSLLLLTTRNPNLVAVLGFAQLAGLIWADRRYFASQSSMKTWDGVAMRTLLFAPFGLQIGRNLMLHGNNSELLVSLLFTTLTLVFYTGLPRVLRNSASANASRLISLAPAAVAWVMAVEATGLDTDPWFVPATLIPFTMIAALMSTKMTRGGHAVRRTAALVAVGGALIQLMLFESAYSSLLMVGTSLSVIVSGYAMKERWIFRIGLGGLGVGLIYHLRYAAELYQSDWIWLSLAGTGVLVILCSSYLERYGRQGWQSIRTLHHKVSQWK